MIFDDADTVPIGGEMVARLMSWVPRDVEVALVVVGARLTASTMLARATTTTDTDPGHAALLRRWQARGQLADAARVLRVVSAPAILSTREADILVAGVLDRPSQDRPAGPVPSGGPDASTGGAAHRACPRPEEDPAA